MECQRLDSEHTSFWSSFYKRQIPDLHLMLHFPEKEGHTGKLKKVQNIVQHLSEQFRNYYVPKKNVSVDENLIGYKGRGLAIQYMPNK